MLPYKDYLKDIFKFFPDDDEEVKNAINDLTVDEKNDFLAFLENELKSPEEYKICKLFRYFAKDFYCLLSSQTKEIVERCVVTGIVNGKLNSMTGKVSGTYSVATTWAAEFIEQLDAKEQIIAAVRQHALKSPLSQNYAIWYFHDYVTLDKEENLEYYKNIFLRKKNLRKIDYDFLCTFISDKRSKLYHDFCDLIDRYENKRNLTEEDRLPEIDELFGDKIYD